MRKIIHIDMDCFYAAVEELDDPTLRGKPLAVAGRERRSVLTTANYAAREYGCRSAMPVFKALELCPHLKIVPVRFDRYRAVSAHIRSIFGRFTDVIEPLSLDEAYLDVSHIQSSAAAVAREIRAQIMEETGLTASAGISSNKMIAKIASDWNKPDGQYEVKEENIASFVATLPVGRLWGVGGKTKDKLEALGVLTCADLQKFDQIELARRFGRWGNELWQLCRGMDDRPVLADRIRKSLSVESTFAEDLGELELLLPHLRGMIDEISGELAAHHESRVIRSLVVKLKFSDFERTTVERAGHELDHKVIESLLVAAWQRGRGRSVRLLGVGVRFLEPKENVQLEFFE